MSRRAGRTWAWKHADIHLLRAKARAVGQCVQFVSVADNHSPRLVAGRRNPVAGPEARAQGTARDAGQSGSGTPPFLRRASVGGREGRQQTFLTQVGLNLPAGARPKVGPSLRVVHWISGTSGPLARPARGSSHHGAKSGTLQGFQDNHLACSHRSGPEPGTTGEAKASAAATHRQIALPSGV